MRNTVEVRLDVNGTRYDVELEPRELLSDVLRERLRLYGARVGCEQGVCGACTVLWDGEPVRSCTTLAVTASDRKIETIEGIIQSSEGRQIANAFHEHHALQCGFCTPGFVVSLAAALRQEDSLIEVLNQIVPGHVCRCTGYVNIRAAVEAVWESHQ